MHFQVLLASFAALSAKVSAVTGSTEAQMDVLLNTNDGLDLAYNYAPSVWLAFHILSNS